MRISTLLELGRVSNLPTVWSNVLVAYAVAAGPLRMQLLPLWSAAAAGTCLYVGGMFLNDVFDAEIDAKERPNRPIPSGRATRADVAFVGAALLVAGLALSALPGLVEPELGFGSLFAATLTAVLVVAYDWVHKRAAWSPLLMGGCRAGLYAMGAFAATSTPPVAIAGLAAALFAYVVGLTHVARFETGTTLARTWVLASLALPTLVLGWSVTSPWTSFGPWLFVHVAWVVVSLWRLRSSAPGKIGQVVVSLIAGIALVDSAFAAAFGHVQVALIACGCFGLTLLLQRWIRGT